MSTTALRLSELVLNGQAARKHHADVLDAVTSLTMSETITGASTLRVTLSDPHRTILRSGLLARRTTTVLDGAGFELAQVAKSGPSLDLTFEDIAVAALRRHTGFRTSAAGTTSRADFCVLLCSEEPAIRVVAAPGAPSKVALARGTGKTASAKSTEARKEAAGTAEDSWTAMGRIMGEIGWRVFCHRGTIYIAPDSYLIAHAAQKYALSEASKGVDDIGFNWDVGLPAATATIAARVGVRSMIPGSSLTLSDMGVADGGWLLESIERVADVDAVTVTAIRPQPVLPEPSDGASTDIGDLGEGLYQGDYLGLPDDPSDSLSSVDKASSLVEQFIAAGVSKLGHRYEWGASGPDVFDCSGYVAWCAGQAGVHFSKPAKAQYEQMRSGGTLLSVEQAAGTRGAILVRVGRGGTNHIVISMGDGTTIEAMGRAYGVRRGKVAGRVWTSGGYVPGLRPLHIFGERRD